MTEFPEAKTVAYTGVKTTNGFHWSVTFREDTGKDIINKMMEFEKYCLEKGWTAEEIRGGFSKGKAEVKYVEGKVCPKCGGRLVIKTKKDGKPYHKCENGKWDPINKQSSGCPFVDWLEPKQSFDDNAFLNQVDEY